MGYVVARDEMVTQESGRGWDSAALSIWTISNDDTSSSYASFLVAPAAVPVPAAGWLFMTALLGLVGKKRLARR